MGQLWDLYQRYVDRQPFPPSMRAFAMRLGMSPTAFSNWENELSRVPNRKNLLRFADLTGVGYPLVLQAALHDARYLPEKEARLAEAWDEGESVSEDPDTTGATQGDYVEVALEGDEDAGAPED